MCITYYTPRYGTPNIFSDPEGALSINVNVDILVYTACCDLQGAPIDFTTPEEVKELWTLLMSQPNAVPSFIPVFVPNGIRVVC